MNDVIKYPYSKNRLMILDWSSLAYHQIFALASKKKTTSYFDISTPEDELYAWRTKMLYKLLGYIRSFNPRDIVITLEGSDVWRKHYVREYYNDNCDVHYDNTGYFIKFDNFIYHCTKNNEEINFKKLDSVKDVNILPEKKKKLKDLPEKIQKIFWDEVLPGYKSNRSKKRYWPFLVDYKVWRDYKEEFAKQIQKVIRCHVIGMDKAEGDDTIYVCSKYWGEKYDSIILISGDSDMNQLLNDDKLKIYNHKTKEFVNCTNPDVYLDLKVLTGDTSDNINGIALPCKKNQLGEVTARKLYESTDNCYEKAKMEGWDNQYIRNTKLIDLKKIPTDIQRELCYLLDNSKPKMGDINDLYSLNVTDVVINRMNTLRNQGFYALQSYEAIQDPSYKFNENVFIVDDEDDIDFNDTQRQFTGVNEVFGDPF